MATYRFIGKLCGYLCEGCDEPLAGARVRLYRAVQQTTERAVANPKDTFALVDDIKAKAARLIAEAEVDDKGSFAFTLGAEQKYAGEAFEVDVYCATVPHRKPTPKPPVPRQFSITTLQPQWRESGDALVAGWEYCIPSRFWCYLRGLFGAWTICGKVTVCKTDAPLGGVRVFAFDRDWLQDDALGSAVTNGSGGFRIDYTTADFAKTIFPAINIELFGGPDIYFRIETLGGTVLLSEPPSRGRDPDRENRGPCFCVKLCVPDQPSIPPTVLSAFTNLGGYDFTNGGVDTASTGLTSDTRAFFSTVRLNGILAKLLNNQPLEYMFEVKDITAGGGYTQVAAAQIARTEIGKLEIYAPAFPLDPNPVKTRPYTVNGTASPTELVTTFTADGWIRVPQENDVFGAGNFVANGNMINLMTTTLNAWPAKNMTGLGAGQDASLVGGGLASDRMYALRMWVREAGNPGSAIIAGECARAAIDNTLYDNELHHPDWAGWSTPGQLAVFLLDIQELQAGGCVELSTSLTVLLTAAHPNLGAVSVTMTGPGGPYGFLLPAAVGGQRFGTATPNGWTFASIPDCAYIVTLEVQARLTTGDAIPSDVFDQVAFCKKTI
jgi:hypothetical protein